ncbi:MAG: hypothetical protein O3A10_07585 [Chloroflexi bacterium]|nr:hypothetical protein [Chloroflexota bacterium]MDA1145730.1 hypothetical protein [Chloroflexota bacterium]
MSDQPASVPSPDSDHVELDEHIEAAPAEVFEYLTDPERRPFGRDDTLDVGAEVIREAPSRVAWEVTVADGAERFGGLVEITIEPDGSGSRVRVTHRIARPATRPAAAPAGELALAV